MGGPGSGRWRGHVPRTTVEECFALDICDLKEKGLLDEAWDYYHQDAPWPGVKIDIAFGESPPRVRLFYEIERIPFRVEVELESTKPHFGGKQWYWSCPTCGRRSRILYLVPGGVQLACRCCHDLTYRSCQESHQFDGLYRRIAQDVGVTPEAVKRVFEH